MVKIIFMVFFLTGSFVYAQAASQTDVVKIQAAGAMPTPQAATTVAPVAPTPSQPKAVEVLKKADTMIPLEMAGWVLALLTFLIEMLMRFFPTVKPRSLFILMSSIMQLVASIFMKTSNLLDKIVQNLKEK